MSTIRVAAARWDDPSERATLPAIRPKVVAREQRVPEALEWDERDADARHVLAYHAQDRPLGCARLAVRRKIGRMAMLADGRGQDVDQALLQHLIERARAQDWPTLSLDAQLHAQDFYERAGFRAKGQVFDDAGIAHRTMRLTFANALETMRD